MAYYINKGSTTIYKKEVIDQCEVFRVEEPNFKETIPNANMRRRMSRIVKLSVSSALECLEGASYENIGAIITSTGLGCLHDTEKFMDDIIKYDEGTLNPTTFIQSTFNTIAGQLALILGIKAYNMTYVHRGLSFESALIDALLCLDENKKSVLIGGFDELTGTSFRVQRRLGLFCNGYKAGEGTNFFLLSDAPCPKGSVELIAVRTYSDSLSNEQIELLLQENGLSSENIELLLSGKKDSSIISLFSQARKIYFKEQCGEYATAVAYGLDVAVTTLLKSSLHYSLVYNTTDCGDESSLILLKKV